MCIFITFRSIASKFAFIQKGDKLGLIGHNGSGKTTLLRVMAGVYPPTDGRIRCEGRIAALLDISLGFELKLFDYNLQKRIKKKHKRKTNS